MKLSTLLLLLTLGTGSLFAQSQTFFLDVGPDDVTNGNATTNPDANGFYWNNVTNGAVTGTAINLIDTLNQATGAYVEVTDGFSSNGINHGGLLAPDPLLLGNLAVGTATQDYFFETTVGSLEFGGLDAGAGYVFDLFGTRQTTITRESQYTLTGDNIVQGTLQTSGAGIGNGGYDGNNDSYYITDTVYANASGIITLDLNVVSGGFAYLGMMRFCKVKDAPMAAPTVLSRSFWLDLGPDDGTNGNATTNPDANGNYWNNLSNPSTNSSPVVLVESDNTTSKVEARIATDFSANGILNGGLLAPSPALLNEFAIASATEDYFFTTARGTLFFDSLDTDKAYRLQLFGSRNTTALRRTRYTISGSNLVVDSLQSSGTDLGGPGYHGNNSTVLQTQPVRPDANGSIRIDVEVSAGGFAYLNALRLDEVAVAQDFYVDFGPDDATNGNATPSPDANGRYWNNVTNPTSTVDTVFLTDANNQASPGYLLLTQPFLANGILNGGLLAPDPGLLNDFAVATATQDYFFVTGTGAMEIGGLDTAKGYIFHLFGTRTTAQDRVTAFDLTGDNLYSGTLQTSGADLGGPGYDGNNSTVLVTDTLYPQADGTIDLSVSVSQGGFAYLGALKMEATIPLRPRQSGCATRDTLLVSVMGSSVAFGTGATGNQGYATRTEQMLDARFAANLGPDWDFSNISIPGNSTVSLLNRFDTDLLEDCGSYVVYGVSLGNEGILTQGQAAFDQFRDNLELLIDKARDEGLEPIVVNCYPRNDYTATEYDFTKQMNLLIHSWDVPSVNALGAIDNGTGQFAAGFFADVAHPNDAGHAEFSYAFVPSMFDAIRTGKTQPAALVTNTFLNVDKTSTDYQLAFAPEGTVHAFTKVFDVRTTGVGPLASVVINGGNYASLFINLTTGVLDYQTNGVTTIGGSTVINDGNWHQVVLTHYYAQGLTLVYVDNVLQGSFAETIDPAEFILSEKNAPTANYRNWFVYRSAINADEVAALFGGGMLKSSLELYAPLDQQGITGPDTLVNLALSTNAIAMEPATEINGTFPVEWIYVSATPQGQQVRLDWTVANERNNAGFEVEIRPAGAATFTSLAFVDSRGDLTGSRSYQFLTESLAAGQYEFRLRQIDWDGRYQYSQRMTAEIFSEQTYALYPQPCTDQTTLLLPAHSSEALQLELLDLQGRVIQAWHKGQPLPGQSEWTLRLEAVPAGIYHLRISDGQTSETLRIIKR